VLHYAHWCPGCQQMRPVYAEVRRRLAGRPIIMGEHDEEVSRTPGVTKYPTIYMLDEYGSKREYRGRANLAELTKFILAPL
jgi:thiol-disulfide isomerase/thioredoxin